MSSFDILGKGTLGMSNTSNKFEALGNFSELMTQSATNVNAEPLFYLSYGFDFNAEIKDAEVDKNTFQAIVGNSSNDFSIMYDEVVLVPVKRHKKRRIQKKWIKRYGYKEIRVPKVINGVEIEQISDNEFMFVKENNDND